MKQDEILREMGIWPIWRLREPHAPGQGAGADEPAAVEAPTPVPPLEIAAAAPSPAEASATAAETPVSTMDWEALERTIAGCRKCSLCQQRKQTVPGVGDRKAEWLFIGEGPGAEEDERGEPFVGPAGRLLDAMLAAIGLQRGDRVYIANAVKCRPPGNRTPTPEEMAACRPYLERQIALIEPRLIVLLGKAAAHTVLGSDGTLSGMRGQRFDFRGIPVVVTYHPAYLLRSLPDKAKAWQDLCFARRHLANSRAGS